MDTAYYLNLNFEENARKAFAFLCELGFAEIEALPTLVRYQKDGIEVNVYYGRQSHEIGASIIAFGNRYPISTIIRITDPKEFDHFHYTMASTPDGVAAALEDLSLLMKHYGRKALEGDFQFFLMLERQQRMWAEDYALDVLTRQLRPQADEAFRKKDYLKATELYSRIKERLSPAELKKLNIAEKYCK